MTRIVHELNGRHPENVRWGLVEIGPCFTQDRWVNTDLKNKIIKKTLKKEREKRTCK